MTEVHDAGAGSAAAIQSLEQWREDIAVRYDGLLSSVTLAQLSQAFPEASWLLRGVLVPAVESGIVPVRCRHTMKTTCSNGGVRVFPAGSPSI